MVGIALVSSFFSICARHYERIETRETFFHQLHLASSTYQMAAAVTILTCADYSITIPHETKLIDGVTTNPRYVVENVMSVLLYEQEQLPHRFLWTDDRQVQLLWKGKPLTAAILYRINTPKLRKKRHKKMSFSKLAPCQRQAWHDRLHKMSFQQPLMLSSRRRCLQDNVLLTLLHLKGALYTQRIDALIQDFFRKMWSEIMTTAANFYPVVVHMIVAYVDDCSRSIRDVAMLPNVSQLGLFLDLLKRLRYSLRDQQTVETCLTLAKPH